jgi:hypothetical protein
MQQPLIGAVVATLAMISCGGGTPGSTTPPATPAPAAASCSVPIAPAALVAAPAKPKPASTDDRRTRRGRAYEELWKHQAALARRRLTPAAVAPAATAEDVGQVAVVRDEGDLILPANPYDLRGIDVTFARNGSGGYDLRRSDRQFQSAVGEKIPLGDDDSARVALPFSFPFYAARYAELFVNSDGNVTFGVEEHASSDRNVARFLTGPPRIAPIFDDLDPSTAGGVYRRTDGDALLITWCDVPEFDSSTRRMNVQLRLAADGTIDFVYGTVLDPSAAVVGVSPGETGVFTPVDIDTVAAGPIAGGTGLFF